MNTDTKFYKKQYIIVKNTNMSIFISEINKHINEQAELIGGVSAYRFMDNTQMYLQAMFINVEVTDKTEIEKKIRSLI